jgi:hypothetical protein
VDAVETIPLGGSTAADVGFKFIAGRARPTPPGSATVVGIRAMP